MLTPSPFNRQKIKEYLTAVSEENLVDEIILPLFHKNGYSLLRRVKDGPGEHGKDIIFYRNVPLFFDHEYVTVQAKAEKVTTQNVAKFADQIKRAMTIPFQAKSGVQRYSNYVLFINAREHTNDVEFEFAHLAGYQQNVKILHQGNLIQMIIDESIVPSILDGKLETYAVTDNDLNKRIEGIIGSGDNLAINRLLDDELHLHFKPLLDETKGFVVNYIFHTWRQDKGFKGTVRPMRWLNQYFHFIQPNQYKRLIEVLSEYTTSHPSFEALPDTKTIIEKITAEQVKTFEKEFFERIVQTFRNETGFQKHPLMKELLQRFGTSNLMGKDYQLIYKLLFEQEVLISQIRREGMSEESVNTLRKQYKDNDSKLFYFLYPEELTS